MELVSNLSAFVRAQHQDQPGYSDKYTWQFCDALLSGGKKGFGSEPSHRSLKVLRLMLPHVSPGGVVLACVTEEMRLSELLAVRSAAERLCLWYRAHEITKGNLLAGYFETAFAYFLEFYGEKDEKTLKQEMSASKFRPLVRPAPKKRESKASVALTATAAVPPSSDKSNSAGPGGHPKPKRTAGSLSGAVSAATEEDVSSGVVATTSTRQVTKKPSRGSPAPTQGSEGPYAATSKPSRKPSLASKSGGTVTERSRRGRTNSTGADLPRPRLDVDLQPHVASKAVKPTAGAVIDIAPEKPISVATSAAGWVQLARGPAFAEVEEWLLSGTAPASKRRPIQRDGLGNVVEMPGAVAGRVGFDEWDVLAGPSMLAEYDNDAQDGAWWQRKYRQDEAEADSLSEASESDSAPPDELLFDARMVDRAREGALLEE